MSEPAAELAPRKKTNWAVFIPVAAFLVLAAMFAMMLLQKGRDTSAVPSVFIGKAAPETPLPAIPGLMDENGAPIPGFDPAGFPKEPLLVNVWASWCAPCRQEHPLLMALAKREGVTIAGFNYKDKTANALSFLSELGNPFAIAGSDLSGRAGIEWGVYGVPETFIVGADGAILYKHVGPLTPDAIENKILPRLQDK